MRRQAHASIEGDDSIIGILLRTGIAVLAEPPSLALTAVGQDLILIDSSQWLRGSSPTTNQGRDPRTQREGRDP